MSNDPVETFVIGTDSADDVAVYFDYDTNDPYLLKGLDAVRVRPGMYIGDNGGIRGLHYLFKEILDNAVDEIMAGHCDAVTVTLGTDGSVSVTDNGRGIPTELFDDGKSGVEVVFTELHAGGKFEGKGYKVSGGLHGAGTAPVNALSAWVEVTVRQNGTVHWMRFEDSVPVAPLAVISKCGENDHGTIVTWLADKAIFTGALTENGELSYDAAQIRHRLQELAYLLPAARFVFENQRDGETTTYQFANGIADFVAMLNHERNVFPAEPIRIFGEQGNCRVQVAIQWSDAPSETIRSFANTRETPDGGTHVTGLRRAVTRAVNQFGFAAQIGKRSLTAVVSVQLPSPSYYSAETVRLVNREAEGIVFSVVYAALKDWQKR